MLIDLFLQVFATDGSYWLKVSEAYFKDGSLMGVSTCAFANSFHFCFPDCPSLGSIYSRTRPTMRQNLFTSLSRNIPEVALKDDKYSNHGVKGKR